MKVKVYIPYIDFNGHKGELVFDADLNAPCLETRNGCLDIKEPSGMRIDCMPEK